MDFSAKHRFPDAQIGSSTKPQPTTTSAEQELSERFTQRLRLFAARRIHDATSAEDIAQETLRLVMAALREKRVENLDALPGFVFSTARNLCLHWVRSAARERSALERLAVSGAASSTAPIDALASVIGNERRNVVRAALQDLSESDRQLLSMLYYEGIETDEAASSLGITAAAVRVRKHRALLRLARVLGESIEGNTTDGAGTLD